jgi:hypothetical protein
MKNFFRVLILLIVFQSCQVLHSTHSYRLDFGKLAMGDTVRVVKKDFEGFAVIRDSTVYVGAKFKADSSKLAKLKIVGTLISL